MALRLIRALPGERRLLSPLPGPHRQARIDATVAAPGPHDFAVRSGHHSSIAPPRPSHPAARFVTIASRPFAGRDGEAYATNPNFCKQEYFCARGLTGFRSDLPVGPVCRIWPVNPERCEASSPESITAKEVGVHSAAPDNCRLWLWIPGSRQGAPRNDEKSLDIAPASTRI